MNLKAWLALLEKRHPQAIDLGLQRCGRVYRRMQSPRPANMVYTVAGTNGKGSTVAYLAAMSGALGQRHGTYTSPHIFKFNERIKIQGKSVSDQTITRAFEEVEAARGDISLTYFEFTTLAGLLVLQQAELDCAVLEVGLGGRLDTVNLVDADCVVITPIGLDHQDFLGADIASIAREKAGVLRKDVPVVCTQAEPPAELGEIARKLNAPVYVRGLDYDISACSEEGDQTLDFSMNNRQLTVSRPVMAGRHQLDNLAAALAAVLIMNPDACDHAQQISASISDCAVAGRLQRVCSVPEILLDVGHNELAAEAIADYLLESGKTNISCVLAMLKDKSAEAVALALGGVCKRWFCTSSSGARAQSGEMLARRVSSALPDADVGYFESMAESLQMAVSKARVDDTILVFGSFTTVSAAADWLKTGHGHEVLDAAKLTLNDD